MRETAALNADEVRECEQVAKATGKLLMFAFVCRFRAPQTYLKNFIDAGKMGKFVSAQCIRTSRCAQTNGWYISREKGGGTLRDECIHEIDSVLYFMGYPKPVAVMAKESFVNSDLPSKIDEDVWKSYADY